MFDVFLPIYRDIVLNEAAYFFILNIVRYAR